MADTETEPPTEADLDTDPESSGGEEDDMDVIVLSSDDEMNDEGESAEKEESEKKKKEGEKKEREEDEYTVEKIVGTKLKGKWLHYQERSYKVRWLGWDPSSDTWEPEINLLTSGVPLLNFWYEQDMDEYRVRAFLHEQCAGLGIVWNVCVENANYFVRIKENLLKALGKANSFERANTKEKMIIENGRRRDKMSCAEVQKIKVVNNNDNDLVVINHRAYSTPRVENEGLGGAVVFKTKAERILAEIPEKYNCPTKCSCVGQCSVENGCECVKYKKNLVKSVEDDVFTSVFCGKECGCGANCRNKRFPVYSEKMPDLVIKRSPVCYWNVFPKETVEKMCVVFQLIGEVFEESQLVDRIKKLGVEAALSRAIFFTGSNGERLFIDASMRGNASRYVRHSCDPNLLLMRVHQSGRPPSFFFLTKQRIEPNQPFTYDFISDPSKFQFMVKIGLLVPEPKFPLRVRHVKEEIVEDEESDKKTRGRKKRETKEKKETQKKEMVEEEVEKCVVECECEQERCRKVLYHLNPAFWRSDYTFEKEAEKMAQKKESEGEKREKKEKEKEGEKEEKKEKEKEAKEEKKDSQKGTVATKAARASVYGNWL